LLLGKWWQTVNSENGILSIAICGKRGSGKSWVMLLLAWLLDRKSNDISKFSIDKVSFKASEFLEWLNAPKKTWKKGSVICLDDAGLHMYNRDSLTNFIKIINKTLQNIRYKHPIVILTLPSFQMLDKHARDMTDIYIEVSGKRDKERKENLCKIQEMVVRPYDANILRYNIEGDNKRFHPMLKIKIKDKPIIHYRFETPPPYVVDLYEDKKTEYLDQYNAMNIKALKREEARQMGKGIDKRQKMSFLSAVNYCYERIEKYKDKKGKIGVASIMLETDLDGRQMFGKDQAQLIAQALRVKMN
jgi:hypothetical protein